MNVFSIQCQEDSGEALRYNREIHPRVFMGIEVDKLEFYQQVHADNPGVGVVWRHWPNRPWADDPERGAKETVQYIGGRIGHLLERAKVRWVTDNNEYVLSNAPPDLVEKADRYMAAFIRAASVELGVGTCWGNFNTGHWGGGPTGGREIVDAFPRALAAAQEDGDSPICFHEYNWPEIPDEGHWTCGKVLRAMPAIAEQYPTVRCMVTEFGVDDGGNPHKGWRLAHPDYDEAVEAFCGGLEWYDREVVRNAPWLDAVVIFGCGMSHWASFDIAGEDRIFETIKTLGGAGPVPEPPEEPEEPMTNEIKVIDLQYQERDFAYAEDKYGVAFRRAEVEPGQKVYRLVELWEKTGVSGLGTQVLDEDGQPMANADVAFYWPDAPEQGTVYLHDWSIRFVHGPTNVNGDIAPGMGPGAYHGEGEGGPHAVWVRDPAIPSDICEKLGMLAGTFHDHLDQVFKLTVEPSGGGEPPQGNGGEKVLKFKERVEIDADANTLGIALPVDYAVEQDARGSFRGPGVDLVIHPDEWYHPDGTRWAIMGGCANFNGEEMEFRTYTMRAHNLKTGDYLTEEHEESFASLETGLGFNMVVYIYELVEGGQPPEEPPSQSDSVAGAIAALARKLAAAMVDFAADLEGLG